MQLKGIKTYSRLLADIAHKLNIHGEEVYRFAKREKSNFSKMLKGKRQLKYEFIIPLEAILGTSLAKMMDHEAFKLPVEKECVPFIKGFRYYAYKDDPDLYLNELDNILDKDGKSILNNMDEFGKTFLDYIVEYHAVNGVKYLYNEYGIKLKWSHNQFTFKRDKGLVWLNFENSIEFARLVASMDDSTLFYGIYDCYNMFFSNGHYATDTNVFCQADFLEIIMDSETLFNNLFKVRKYDFKLGGFGNRKIGQAMEEFYCANPILNNCLRHALTHLNKYRRQAIEILKFGIRNNDSIKKGNNTADCFINELGGIYDLSKERRFIDLAIFVDVEDIQDAEIKELVDNLPKFNVWR